MDRLYILVVSDYFTRWPEAYATADHKTATVTSKLINEWVSCFGVIQHLHTQTRGQHFTSNIFQNLTNMLGVDKRCTTPYHLVSNGMVQRINCTLKNILAKVPNKNQSE